MSNIEEKNILLRSLGTIVPLLLFVALTACDQAPGGRPSSAEIPVKASEQGILSLFDQECLKQRNSHWAKEETNRKIATCPSFLTGPGEQGDCEAEQDGSVEWLNPLADGGTAKVVLFWSSQDHLGPPQYNLHCSVAFPEKFGQMLKHATSKLSVFYSNLLGPSDGNYNKMGVDFSLYWHDRSGRSKRPIVVLAHHVPSSQLAAWLHEHVGPRAYDGRIAKFYEPISEHPWELIYLSPQGKLCDLDAYACVEASDPTAP
jgi:hypothetical protein